MKIPTVTIVSVVAALMLATTISAQTGESAVKVGDKAPDFELADANGTRHKLSELRGDKAVVIEFFRSGSW